MAKKHNNGGKFKFHSPYPLSPFHYNNTFSTRISMMKKELNKQAHKIYNNVISFRWMDGWKERNKKKKS